MVLTLRLANDTHMTLYCFVPYVEQLQISNEDMFGSIPTEIGLLTQLGEYKRSVLCSSSIVNGKILLTRITVVPCVVF